MASKQCIGQRELAARWDISPKTLERWRVLGIGPTFLKLGGRVVYQVEDVERYEARHRRASTSEPLAAGGAFA